MKNSFYLIAILPLIATNVFAQHREFKSLSEILEFSKENSPSIKQTFHNYKSEEFKTRKAKSLPDPKFSYTYFGESIQTKVGPQQQKYSISQMFPFYGKRKIKQNIQSDNAEAAKQKYQMTLQKVSADIKQNYYDLFWVQKAIEINLEVKSTLENVEKVAQKKYESNLIGQQDVIKLGLEISNLTNKIKLLEQNKISYIEKLKSLMGTAADIDIVDVQNLEMTDFNYELNDLLSLAKSKSYELNIINSDKQKAKEQMKDAKLAFIPDVTLGAEYVEIGSGTTNMVDDGKDAWMVMASINLPIWSQSLNDNFKSADESLKNKEFLFNEKEKDIEFIIKDLYSKILSFDEIINTFNNALLPQAEQMFNASQFSFEAGKTDFLNWLDTQRTFLNTKLAYYKSVVDYNKTIAQLEFVVGGDL